MIRLASRLGLAAIALLGALKAAWATTLLAITITGAVTAQTGPVYQVRPQSGAWEPGNVLVQCNFTYGSGGTTADAWVQTSADGGSTWVDAANCHFTTSSLRELYNLSALTAVTTAYTATDGTLAANTAKDGMIGPRWRVKYTTTGTYAASTTLQVDIQIAPMATTTSP